MADIYMDANVADDQKWALSCWKVLDIWVLADEYSKGPL